MARRSAWRFCAARDHRLGPAVVVAHRAGDVGEVARALGRDRGGVVGRRLRVGDRQPPVADREAEPREQRAQVPVERGDAVVVEGRGAGAVDRHVLPRGAERVAVAHELAGDVAAGVVGAAALELVDRHDVGEVQHVDLLELRGGAELGRHDVQRGVDVVDDPGVALADAGGLDDDEVDARGAQQRDRVGEVLGQRSAAAPRGHRAEVDLRPAEGVHADAVAEQRAAALAARRVDGEHRDPELVLLVEAEAAHELVGQRRLARAAGAGDAEHRDRPCPRASRRRARGSRRAAARPRRPTAPARAWPARRRRRRPSSTAAARRGRRRRSGSSC